MTPQETTGEKSSENQSRLARIMAEAGKRAIGQRVYSMRRAKELTIHELASKAQIDVRCVIAVEDGMGATEANLRKMLAALRAKPEDLLAAV